MIKLSQVRNALIQSGAISRVHLGHIEHKQPKVVSRVNAILMRRTLTKTH
jgi:hypothetical protein